ncbi:type II secretion system protein [Thalassomonas viridans]|uniref:Type II secretion system protein n=1 Tax=Thalassomonas viridans TaxID=137584 RepID=A0AAE9Z0Q4_9GAMM|nr:type II secretion system protein [Thalassomonas viridans]WDE04495.1 type II secretion system protein [Thalassomonas viridans]
MHGRSSGFTLIESVTVIILLGILAVSVLPRFSGTRDYEIYAYRSQLISALRLTQQRAMQQTNTTLCHQIVVENSRFGVPDRTDCDETNFPADWQPDLTGAVVESKHNITFDINGNANPSIISFNGMGVPQDDCSGGCTLNITGEYEALTVLIAEQGYIRAG